MKTMKRKKWLFAALFSLLFLCGTVFGVVLRAHADTLSGRWIKTPSIDTAVNVADGEFSVVVMGDQQIVLGDNSKYLTESYDYLVEHKDEMNLKMYLNVGDIFDVVDFTDDIGGYNKDDPYGRNRGSDPDTKYWFQQKEYVSEQITKLENANIPVALTMGNHEYEDMAFNYRINKTFNEAFPLSRFEKYAVGDDGVIDDTHYFGGAQYADIEQAYYYFEGNGQKYMVLSLGLFPSDEMIAWANRVVEENADCKVIVNTHAYFDIDGRPYERGDYLWKTFLSQHENICMLVCGHDWDDGGIIRQVDYGVHGNPVYQFMINTQGEEFGGLGLFAQFIFRTDGSVDCAYYAPAVEKYKDELRLGENAGMYFMSESQFSFDLGIAEISADESDKTTVGKTITTQSLYENYIVYSPQNRRWLQNVYDYKNVFVSQGKGLYTNGEGYITYKIAAGAQNRINGLSVLPICKFVENSAYQIDVSSDGVVWENALYQDNVTGRSNSSFDLDRSVLGAKDLYVRLLLRGTENFYMKSLQFDVQTVKTVNEESEGSFSLGFDVTQATQQNYDENMYAHLDTWLTEGQLLGTGGNGYLGGKAFLLYRFDAPEGKALKTLHFDATMRISEIARTYSFTEKTFDYYQTGTPVTYSEAQTFGFKEQDSLLALRILVSYDGGSTFEEVITYNNADSIGESKQFSCDIPVENKSSIVVKLQYFGTNRTNVGFKSLSFTGSYLSVESGYVLNGGIIYGDSSVPCKDGYVFAGWFVNGEKTDTPEQYENTGVAIEARWKKIVSVIYVTGDVANVAQNKTILFEGDMLELTDLQAYGKTFAGWYDINGNRYKSISAGESDIVLYAIFY